MNRLYKHLSRERGTREEMIVSTALLGVIVNIVLAVFKLIVGMAAASIAIVSEGINGVTDTFSSLLAMMGVKLSKKCPGQVSPCGGGRLESLSGLLVAALILFSGIAILLDAIGRIGSPEPLHISYLSLGVVAVSAVIKFYLGQYTIRMGKIANSSALTGVGKECRNDCLGSLFSILTALIFLVWRISLDAYAGLLISALILKSGVDLVLDVLRKRR